ncbi:hypothetical protein GO009_04700 [Muricauda sp. TY007]|nr:hypothetical protein [Muricauda sp. TY007]NDV15317.1 hypothetical protein [Muricauda sp. TY007]
MHDEGKFSEKTFKLKSKLAAEAINIELELQDWFTLLVAGQGHGVP